MTTSSVTQHAIHEIVERLLALEGDPRLFTPEISSDEVLAYARDKTFVAAKLVKSYLAQIDPLAVSVWGLSQAQAAIQNLFNELTAFLSNGNVGHIHNAGSQVDQALYPLLWVFAARASDGGLKATELAIESVSKASATTFSELVTQREKLTTEFASLRSQIDTQTARLETMTTAIATQKADAAAVTATVQQSYAKEEAERTLSFNTAAQAMKAAFAQIEEMARTGASAVLTDLEKSKTDAANIVGVVGNIGVTGNYQQIANEENKAAGLWRWITLGFFGGGILLAACTFYEFWKEPVNATSVWAIAIRLLYAIALAAPAWYTATESARHRTNSDRARQTELELASLGPFIELLDKDKKDAIRAELTKQYFGRVVEAHENAPIVSGKDLASVAIEAIKALSKPK